MVAVSNMKDVDVRVEDSNVVRGELVQPIASVVIRYRVIVHGVELVLSCCFCRLFIGLADIIDLLKFESK